MLRRRRPLVLCLTLLVAAQPAFSAHAADLASQVEAVIGRPEYRTARWGILVVDAETGKTIYQQNADQSFVPASVNKLYFCAAALVALGSDYQFKTPVYRRGAVVEGRLEGDLILVASGDLTLGGRTEANGKMAFKDDDHTYANFPGAASEVTPTDPLAGLKSLARQVAAAGIRRVQGDVLIDDRLFETTAANGNGAAWLSPIVVNDNLLDVEVTPARAAGAFASVKLRPATDFFRLDARVLTVTPDQPTSVSAQLTGPGQVTVRGQVAAESKPLLRCCPVQDPAAFARALFIEALGSEGVTVAASPSQQPRAALPPEGHYGELTRVALFTSPPFAELLKVTLKTSSNLYANTFPLLLAAQHGDRTLAQGLQWQRRVLHHLGQTAVDDVSLATASGLTRADALTPQATVQLLQALSRRPDYPVLRAGLPVLGVDGTLADMVPADSPARGSVQAKTGTSYIPGTRNGYAWLRSKALAGTMTTASGRPLFFVLFLNDMPLPPGVSPDQQGRVLGHLCEILYQETPPSPLARPAGWTPATRLERAP